MVRWNPRLGRLPVPQRRERQPDADFGLRILVVDDDAGVRGFVVTTLTLAGYECIQAASAAEALERIDTTTAAVVLDNRLPDGTGTELLPRLRARRGSTTMPILLVTGDD